MKVEDIDEKDITAEDSAAQRIVVSGGKFKKLSSTSNVILNNTGIVHAYSINPAIALIKASGVKGPEAK